MGVSTWKEHTAPEPTLHFIRAPPVLGKEVKLTQCLLCAKAESLETLSATEHGAKCKYLFPLLRGVIPDGSTCQQQSSTQQRIRHCQTIRSQKTVTVSLVKSNLQPATNPATSGPSTLLHCSKSSSQVFNYQISRRSATDHRNKCSSCPSTHPTKAPQLPHITSFNSGWIQHLPWEMAVALPASHRPYIFLRKRKPH